MFKYKLRVLHNSLVIAVNKLISYTNFNVYLFYLMKDEILLVSNWSWFYGGLQLLWEELLTLCLNIVISLALVNKSVWILTPNFALIIKKEQQKNVSAFVVK